MFQKGLQFKSSFKLLKYSVLTKRSFLKCLSTSEQLIPVKLASSMYESSTNFSQEPPFVILHGLFGSKQNWSSLCKAYNQKMIPQRKIIALDLRNHGESEHSDLHTYAHLAADVKHFLLENNIDKVALMGHSMGGRCAMLFALNYPELVEQLIIVDISPITQSPTFGELPSILTTMESVQFPVNVTLSKARTIVDKQLAENIPSQDMRAFILTNMEQIDNQRYKWRINIPGLLNNFDLISDFPTMSNMMYKGKTLFLGGGNSGFIPMSTPQNFSKFFNTVLSPKLYIQNVRNKMDLAKTANYRSIIDLAYASFQGTESIFVRGKKQELPTPLVIVHGILGSKSNFNSLSKRYHDSTKPKRLVYAVDLRNHGDSAHSKDNSYDDCVMDILKFLQTMDLKKVTLLGHDIGGRVGMLFSLKYPEYVEKLIVVDISPITTSHTFQIVPEILKVLNDLQFPRNMTLQQAKLHAATHLARLIKNRGQLMFVLMNLVQHTDGRYSWRFNVQGLLGNFSDISSFPEIHNITFPGPALFIGGGLSDFIQKSDYPKIQQLFPAADLKYIEGAGHWVHSEKPHEFLNITLDFLNQPINTS